MSRSTTAFWLVWGLGILAFGSYLGARLAGTDRLVFLPGETTSGHHQIEAACDACHAGPFAGRDAMQEKCEGCHLAALDEARDSHPQSKFTDPRNADRAALLDARYCVTCHVEHRPERTQAMGLTIPQDYCLLCHRNIAAERPTHEGAAFNTCASSGCHNFHDNRSIYEDYLLRHADAPDLLAERELPLRNFASIVRMLGDYPHDRFPVTELSASEADAPAAHETDAELLADWAKTAHAAAGVNCTACHSSGGAWLDRPGYETCADCHANEIAGFLQGRHGMRLDVARLGRSLPSMTAAAARLPMRPDAPGEGIDCGSCHGAHRFDTNFAAVDACLGCHDDDHSRAYVGSPHHDLVVRARAGLLPAAEAVSCATCHLPRTELAYEYGAYVHVLVEHNQSDNLRPNDKMLRSVCLDCHGLGFSIDALADGVLIDNNFDGRPGLHVESIDFALERRRAVDAERGRIGEGE